MDWDHIIKNTQEQAVAAWVDFLNQTRLNELMAQLTAADITLEDALSILSKTKADVATLILRNRGGEKGVHGFIAEAMEVGIENARAAVNGLGPACQWVNDNGPVDIVRGNTAIQQKFVQRMFSLLGSGVAEHMEQYPDFLQQGGKYQIPKDFYEKVMRLWNMSAEEAKYLTRSDPDGMTPANWKQVHDFFNTRKIDPADLEPAAINYADAQAGRAMDVLDEEERFVRDINDQKRRDAYESSKPTLHEGAQVAAVAGAAEGGIEFCRSVARKLKAGKSFSDFTAEDWKDVGIDTAKGGGTGALRGGTIYIMTNFTATPAAVANAYVTAAFGVAAQAQLLRQGSISEEDFLVNSQVCCLDAGVSAVCALLGTSIPVPIVGPVIGTAVGNILYGIAKKHLDTKEQALASNYLESMERLNRRFDDRYLQLIEQLKAEFAKYATILELAFSPDVNIAFDGSIELAIYVGVPKESILFTKTDIDRYFND